MKTKINLELKARAKNIKAIFFDIDETLFSNKNNMVPKSTVKALKTAKENGLLLFVATGRHKLQIEDVGGLSDIEFDGYITLNGQYCYEREHVVYQRLLDSQDVKLMAEYAQRTSTPCMFLEADSLYINMVDDVVIKEHQAVISSIPEVRDISRVFERDILQMGLYLTSEDIPEILSRLPHCAYTRWKTYGVDIISRDGNKWVGVEKMMKHFGFSVKQIMSFGDNDNDVEMLANSGISVAMGNAEAHVKAVSDYITDNVDKDGVYNALCDFFDWF